jgi:hypothetical protein
MIERERAAGLVEGTGSGNLPLPYLPPLPGPPLTVGRASSFGRPGVGYCRAGVGVTAGMLDESRHLGDTGDQGAWCRVRRDQEGKPSGFVPIAAREFPAIL